MPRDSYFIKKSLGLDQEEGKLLARRSNRFSDIVPATQQIACFDSEDFIALLDFEAESWK